MILENHLDKWGYATILVNDIHKEYPLASPATILWDPNELTNICDEATVHECADRMFKGRVEGFDDWASIWRIKGDLNTIRSVFDELAQDLMGGPRGADDDTYDYWPNAFDMLFSMAKDLINLIGVSDHGTDYLIGTVDRVIRSAIALNGPLEEWEADRLPHDLKALHQLLDDERTNA